MVTSSQKKNCNACQLQTRHCLCCFRWSRYRPVCPSLGHTLKLRLDQENGLCLAKRRWCNLSLLHAALFKQSNRCAQSIQFSSVQFNSMQFNSAQPNHVPLRPPLPTLCRPPALLCRGQYLQMAVLLIHPASAAVSDAPARHRPRQRHRFRHLLRLAQEDIDDGELEQRGEYEQETRRHPHVDRLHVADLRQGTTHGALRRRRQHGEQADGHARRRRLDVDPEGHPREDDDEDARDVDLDHEEADVASQHEPDVLARERPCIQSHGETRTSELRYWGTSPPRQTLCMRNDSVGSDTLLR